MVIEININGKVYTNDEFISIYEFNKENDIAYLIKSFIKLITIHKKIVIVVLKKYD